MQDNCGSFDTLLPELSENHSFLAIDFPGHGMSSFLPNGIFYNFLTGPLLIKQIVDYFQWPQVSLMGHSIGATFNFAYATYTPDTVDLLICIDGFIPAVLANYTQWNADLLEKFIKYSKFNDSKTEPPSFTMEELEKKLHEGTRKSIDFDKCKHIVQRSAAQSKINPGKYYFSMDQRLKAGPHFQGAPDIFRKDIGRVKCPVFLSVPEGSPYNKQKYRKFVNTFLEELKSIEKNEVYDVPGSHHVHLNDPTHLQGLIRSYLAKHDLADRSGGGMPKEIATKL